MLLAKNIKQLAHAFLVGPSRKALASDNFILKGDYQKYPSLNSLESGFNNPGLFSLRVQASPHSNPFPPFIPKTPSKEAGGSKIYFALALFKLKCSRQPNIVGKARNDSTNLHNILNLENN